MLAATLALAVSGVSAVATTAAAPDEKEHLDGAVAVWRRFFPWNPPPCSCGWTKTYPCQGAPKKWWQLPARNDGSACYKHCCTKSLETAATAAAEAASAAGKSPAAAKAAGTAAATAITAGKTDTEAAAIAEPNKHKSWLKADAP